MSYWLIAMLPTLLSILLYFIGVHWLIAIISFTLLCIFLILYAVVPIIVEYSRGGSNLW